VIIISYPPQSTGGDSSTGNISSITTDTTLTSSYYMVLCNASSNSITITLPAASNNNRRIYNIKKTDSTGNSITIDGNASETIDGTLTKSLNLQYESLTIICDGSNWHIM